MEKWPEGHPLLARLRSLRKQRDLVELLVREHLSGFPWKRPLLARLLSLRKQRALVEQWAHKPFNGSSWKRPLLVQALARLAILWPSQLEPERPIVDGAYIFFLVIVICALAPCWVSLLFYRSEMFGW